MNGSIKTTVIMRIEQKDHILVLNEREAREWTAFLRDHEDKEELDNRVMLVI